VISVHCRRDAGYLSNVLTLLPLLQLAMCAEERFTVKLLVITFKHHAMDVITSKRHREMRAGT
jgi:hypothetical protein